jgi:hypothetical protein
MDTKSEEYIFIDFSRGVWTARPVEGYDRPLQFMHPNFIVGDKAYAGMRVMIGWVDGRGMVATPLE